MLIVHAILVLAFIFLTGGGRYAIAEALVCPTEIKVEQKVVELPDGWKEFDSQTRHPLVNVLFSEGEPSEHVILAPSHQKKRKQVLVETWNFSSPSVGYWFSCAYTGTSMVISQRLPSNIKSCNVEYDTAYSTPVAKSLKCR